MRSFCLAALFCYAAISFAAQARPLPEEVKNFEMYSWQDVEGKWNFSLFQAVKSAGFSPEVVMRKSSTLAGLERLKIAIARLPGGSEILWMKSTDGVWKGAKGSERIKYPPADVIAGIRRYCETKQMKLLVE